MSDLVYSKDELFGLPGEEIVNKLAKAWEDEDKRFEVWGELPALGSSTFGFLQNVRLIAHLDVADIKRLLKQSNQFIKIEKNNMFMSLVFAL